MKSVALALLLFGSCSSAPTDPTLPEPPIGFFGTVADIVVESIPPVAGALAGFLTVATPLGVAVGAGVGWLAGDNVEHRQEAAKEKVRADALQKQLDEDTTSTERTFVSFFETIQAWAMPAAIIAVAVAALGFWRSRRRWRMKALESQP